jgi:membrane associated rhomboid family serine protease
LGTGTERTDIVAHLTGFIAGFVPGVILARKFRSLRTTVRREVVLAGIALSVIVASWSLALMQTV